jgi:hypothetical protein
MKNRALAALGALSLALAGGYALLAPASASSGSGDLSFVQEAQPMPEEPGFGSGDCPRRGGQAYGAPPGEGELVSLDYENSW